LDEELLRTARVIAEVRGKTLSVVIGDLAWLGLAADHGNIAARNGFPVLCARPGAQPVTPEHVNQLLGQIVRDEAAGRSGSSTSTY
jgi:hypothetical protein